MDLPKGFFWLMSGGRIGEPHIYSLLNMCEALYRNVLVITDLRIAFESSSGRVKVNEEREGDYDYCFSTDSDEAFSAVYEDIFPSVARLGWRCWMPPYTDAPIPWDDGSNKASLMFRNNDLLDAICIPNIAVKIGPDRDVIFDSSGPISSVMRPNSGDGFWREIFRASGFYGLKSRVIRREAI